MKLPFTTEQFLDVFRNYNTHVFPIQLFLYLLAVAVIWFSIQRTRNSNRIIVIILSFLFIWIGVAYHILHFSEINKAAYLFGAAFIIQSLLFLYYGMVKNRLSFRLRMNLNGIAGIILVLYALIAYPMLGYFNGHIYPYSPTFGAPCPTLIFTFGVFLWSEGKFPKPLLIIPFLWAIVGLSAVSLLGMVEDIGLIISAVASTVLIFVRDRKSNEISGER